MSDNNQNAIWAIVPAAGIGSRMQSQTPKQYLPLQGKTILEITLSKLLQLSRVKGVVVALHPQDNDWQQTSLHHHPKIHSVVGGEERADSVRCALEYCVAQAPGESVLALVHDAARPCVSLKKINELIDAVLVCGDNVDGAILAVPCADTVKRVGGNEIKRTEDRSTLWLAHTPQLFSAKQLLEALNSAAQQGHIVTDESSAIEQAGGNVKVVSDRRDNIKVTVPEDLIWAETILAQQGE